MLRIADGLPWTLPEHFSASSAPCSWYTRDARDRGRRAYEDQAVCGWTCQRGGGSVMTFEELLDHATAMLQRRGRVTYRALQRQFALDEHVLNDLKDELLYAHP